MDEITKNKEEMLKKKRWVVVGVTPNTDKFGYKIFKILKQNQYEVWGVNPRYKELEGELLYDSLENLPETPECISVVVPPAVSLALVDEAAKAGIEYIWFQPGAYNEEVIQKARSLHLKAVYNECVLIALGH